jgi:hypothetical protein
MSMNWTRMENKSTRKVAMMKKESGILLITLLSLSALFIASCASKPAPIPPPPVGGTESLSVFLKDAPADSALSVQVTVMSVSAVTSSGTSVTLTNTPRTYELKHLALAPTLATTQNINSGAYSSISLTLSNPQMQVLDPNGNLVTLSASTTPSITLAQTSVAVPVSLNLASNSNAGIVLDFDLTKSMTTDNQANFVLTPTLTAAVASSADPVPQLLDCVGSVTTLATDGSGFDLQLAESAVKVHVKTDSNTFFDPEVQKLANITAGEVLEITARLQSDGTYLAKAVNGSASTINSRQLGVATGSYTNNSGQTVLSLAVQN